MGTTTRSLYLQVERGTQVSHLLFAEDMLLFTEATIKQLSIINSCLDRFCEHLGQKVSVAKRKIFFSNNVDNSLTKTISDESGFSRCNNLDKYLGVTLLHNRASFSTHSYILEKIQERLSKWKSDKLSMAKRVTLCKSVISALPLYTMQSAALLISICKEIEKICRRFI